MNEDLKNYVRQMRGQGHSYEEIREGLKKEGWTDEEINKELAPQGASASPASGGFLQKLTSSNTVLAVVGIVVVIITAAALMFTGVLDPFGLSGSDNTSSEKDNTQTEEGPALLSDLSFSSEEVPASFNPVPDEDSLESAYNSITRDLNIDPSALKGVYKASYSSKGSPAGTISLMAFEFNGQGAIDYHKPVIRNVLAAEKDIAGKFFLESTARDNTFVVILIDNGEYLEQVRTAVEDYRIRALFTPVEYYL